jgi:GTPase SAR1 family protein
VPKPYFLTRQTTNLMEDLVRDLKSGTGVFLLYGDEGVGKTRLLEELAQSRLQDVEVHWIDLQAGGSGEGALVDSSVLIEDTFARAKTGERPALRRRTCHRFCRTLHQ